MGLGYSLRFIYGRVDTDLIIVPLGNKQNLYFGRYYFLGCTTGRQVHPILGNLTER